MLNGSLHGAERSDKVRAVVRISAGDYFILGDKQGEKMMMKMRSKAGVLLGMAVMLSGLPAITEAAGNRTSSASQMEQSTQGLGAYVGVGVGIPSVAYGSSSLAYKIFGGYQVHEFPIRNAGAIKLAVQGEYINFGNSTSVYSYTNTGLSVAAVGSWVIPQKWAGWADEKLAVLVKLGGASVSAKYNFGSYTYTGVTEGIGAEYRLIPMAGVSAMIENYPNGYQVFGVSGIFHF